MPRRNKTPRHQPYQPVSTSEASKIRYKSKAEAEKAIVELQKYHLDLILYVYQAPGDKGWYLTGKS